MKLHRGVAFSSALLLVFSLGACQLIEQITDGDTGAGPNITSFKAEPEDVAPGERSTLSWTVTGAGPIAFSIDQGVGEVVGGGSVVVRPLATTTYTLTARNSAGADSAQTTVTVALREPDGWEQLGGALYVDVTQDAWQPSLGLGAGGHPIVAWQETSGDSTSIYVKRWDGSTWEQLGGALDMVEANPARGASLAVRPDGRPVVAWQEYEPTSGDRLFGFNIFVKRWDGSNWRSRGRMLYDSFSFRQALSPSLALEGNQPVVAWVGTRTHGDPPRAVNWLNVDSFGGSVSGGSLNVDHEAYAATPSLALDSGGRPVVAWREHDFFEPRRSSVYVKHWDGLWQLLGGPLNVDDAAPAFAPSLAVDDFDRPVVAWSESGVYVKRWGGSEWHQLGGRLDGGRPSLALDPGGHLVVALQHDKSIYVHRWDGTEWRQLGGGLDIVPSEDAEFPSLAIDQDGNPVVAWQEGDRGDRKIFVKRYQMTPP